MNAVDPAEKDLLNRSLQLAEDTNRMVHKMRRAQWWGRVFQIGWWLAIFAVSGFAYYYYLQPYMDQLLKLYQSLQHSGAQAQDYQQQISNFFANWLPHASSTSSSTPQQ